MPKIASILSLILLLSIVFSCKKERAKNKNPVMGSWNLTKYLDHRTQTWKSYGDSIIYQKHLSPNFFVWFKFDKTNEKLLGQGGGTYTVGENEYIEHINFFFPPVPNIIGESIPFEMKFENDQWLHKGGFIQEKMDTESAKIISRDTVKIQETWTKVRQQPNKNISLVNTWQMTAFKDKVEEDYIEYPDFINFIKLITPTHFVWVKYEVHGNEVYATGAGTYTFDERYYSETINMIFPENTGQIGKTIDFEYRLNDNQWYHFGYVPKYVIDAVGIRKDSILIDEYWAPFWKKGI